MSEYLDPAEWLHLAQQLDRGDKASHQHTCGSGPKLLVENKEAGFAAWCYRCSMGGFVAHPKPSLGERIAALRAAKEADEQEQADPRPPMPANFDVSSWPGYARVWLYKAGLSNNVIAAQGIYWCDRIKRVVIPVLDGSKLVYWQARSLDSERAKYINPQVPKTFFYRCGEFGPVVVTEDILSAIKVGQVAQGWAALGTSLTDAQIMLLLQEPKVIVWLDPDAAGAKGRGKMYKQLSAAGVNVGVLRTAKDPKEHTLAEIRAALQTMGGS